MHNNFKQSGSVIFPALSFPKTLLAGLGLLTSMVFAASAQADDFYLGAGAYITDLEVASFEDDNVTPAGFLGYQFLDSNLLMLSVEAGYYDLGSSRGTLGGQRISADASALTIAGVAYLPIGPMFEVYAKAGVGRMDIEGRIGDQVLNEDGNEAFGGVGFAFDFLDTIDIYAEYLRFDNAVDSQMFGIGIRLDLF